MGDQATVAALEIFGEFRCADAGSRTAEDAVRARVAVHFSEQVVFDVAVLGIILHGQFGTVQCLGEVVCAGNT